MITIERITDISRPVQIDQLRGSEFTGEALAHTFRVAVVDGGEPVTLSGGSVSAYFLNASGQALELENGTISDGCAELTLPQACYGVPGRFLLTIFYTVTTDGTTDKTCIYAAAGSVTQSKSNPTYDPGDAVPDLSTLIQRASEAAEDAQSALAQASAVVSYAAQTGQTADEQAQARANIDAACLTDTENAWIRGAKGRAFTLSLVSGQYWKTNGSSANSSKYCKTYRNTGVGTTDAISLYSDTYQYSCVWYDASNNVVGTVGLKTGLTVLPPTAVKYGFNFKRTDDANIADADLTAIAALITLYRITDKDLDTENAPADAKATGDAIGAVTGATDNLLDTAAVFGSMLSGDTVTGTASEFNGKTLLDVTGGGTFTFEWDTKNDGGLTNAAGPNLIAKDASNNTVNVTAYVSGNSASSINMNTYIDYVHRSFSYIFPATAVKIVYGTNGSPGSTVKFSFRNMKITKMEKSSIRKFPDYYPSKTGADLVARNMAERAGYLHDGQILRMSAAPESIPVGDSHLGYADFMDATWNTLLPTGYTAGDHYDASTTKIRNVFVERETNWNSKTYSTNTDSYPVYRFTFTPQTGYDKTVLLTAGCHGNEAEGYWGLFRLIKMIYFEGYKYPTLRNLRNVRFVVIPSWNPWGLQHYKRYNAFDALGDSAAKYAQAWCWLMAENHKVTVAGTEYDISEIGEAYAVYQTLQKYEGALDLWIDFHTDPAATVLYGCYGYAPLGSRTFLRLQNACDDFCNILKDEKNFTTTYHPQSATPSHSSFTGWQSMLGFPVALLEICTFMSGYPDASGAANIMKLAQEYYGTCLAEMLR